MATLAKGDSGGDSGEGSVFFASSNSGKLSEIRQLLSPYGLRILSASDVGDYVAPLEDGEDFADNALIKARAAVAAYGMAAIADDSGLCCSALGDLPGVETARFGGDVSYDEKARLLWEMLSDYADKSAKFVCVVAFASLLGEAVTFRGEVCGRMVYPAESSGGWGYDPYFIPDGYDCSFAALSSIEKNRISHRGIALRAMVQGLQGKFL